MKLVVCAYHNVGYRCIEELLRQGAKISLIFTHQDSDKEQIWFNSVQELAEQHGIPCLTSSINEPENIEKVRQLGPDFLLSFYYRNMIKQELLEIPTRGALNMHGSLLPKYRGRVPVNWAIINGETESGVSLHYMVAKPDAGDLVDQQKVSIDFTDTAFDLFNKVTDAAVVVLQRAWPKLVDGSAVRVPLDLSQGSYFGGRKPEDGRIDWNRSAVEIYNLIRGVTRPYPGAFTEFNGERVIIWSAWPMAGEGRLGQIVSESPPVIGTGQGLLELRSFQYADCQSSKETPRLKLNDIFK